MKRHIRSVGYSTGPVDLDAEVVPLVMVVLRAPDYLEAVAIGDVTIDGEDSTDVMVELLDRTLQRDQIRFAFTNATTMAGFNVIDIERFHATTGVPLISVVRDRPDMDAVEAALASRFDDPGHRKDLLSAGEWREMEGIHVRWSGVDGTGARDALATCTLRGNVPEPLRVAHIIASALGSGVSRGRVE